MRQHDPGIFSIHVYLLQQVSGELDLPGLGFCNLSKTKGNVYIVYSVTKFHNFMCMKVIFHFSGFHIDSKGQQNAAHGPNLAYFKNTVLLQHSQEHFFSYYLCLLLQRQGWVATIEIVWHTMPKIFTFWPFVVKVLSLD